LRVFAPIYCFAATFAVPAFACDYPGGPPDQVMDADGAPEADARRRHPRRRRDNGGVIKSAVLFNDAEPETIAKAMECPS